MRALIHDSFGEPQDVLHVEERPLPEPGPGQIRLRVRLSPIHNHDIWTIRGTYGFKPELPAPAGTEVLGVVDKLGEGVTGIEVGQRGVSGTSFGVWGDYALVDVAGFIPVPEQLPDEAAAQLARARGVNVLGLVRRDEGIEELKAQGIDTVVSTADPKWREQAAEITGGAPIRAGVDSVGGQSSGQVLSLLAQGGTLVVFGAMAGPTMELPSGPIIFRDLKVKGFWGSQVSRDMDPAKKQGLFAELMQRISAGELTLPVAGVFGPEELPAAIDAHFTPGRVGKVLLQF
ncbi:zinc-binding dehydrogenase [Corynebacterium flavescens]|uniref:enoyl-[acyl-carrier-protein] reductase n=1 Tax=Corynebacterium flavescens TaxID=28028 RepID=A0A1L7CKA1_CORFL|nr:zinc-binding dehydrogenase [Corynebacterium flavescens]APT86296.1 NADPH:quinone oxidoreductase [Corynebacterium flavescens]KAA8724561.1 zinc-binding dehydrogenase [Corynebacterium flavescens]GEB98287.1 oxidoreductase/dehydrogenase [Corynebacterium flavescens]